MASERPDTKIKEVLIRAAMEPAFRDRLMKDRAVALDGMGLSPAERNLLMASSPEQLTIMIREAQLDPVVKRGGDYKKVAAYCAVLGGGLLLGSVLCLPTISFGHTAQRRDAIYAGMLLQRISMAEQRYFYQFKCYAPRVDLDRFMDAQDPGWRDLVCARTYEHTIELIGGKYRIVARHREEPDKHPVFFLETDSTVQPLQ